MKISRGLFFCALLALPLGMTGQVKRPRKVSYWFDFRDPQHVQVTLRFRLPKNGHETLQLPSDWAGVSKLYNSIRRLRVSPGKGKLLPSGDPAVWTVVARPKSVSVVHYELVQDWNGPLKHPMEHRAVLRSDFFDFNGQNALVLPDIEGQAAVDLHVKFIGLPAKWHVLTSFGTERNEHFHGLWVDVLNSLLMGGDMRVQHIDVAGAPVWSGIRGEWKFKDEEVATKVAAILRTERNFWLETNAPGFAFTLVPYEQSKHSLGGSSFTNMFNAFFDSSEDFGLPTERLLAHEAFHRWNPGGLGTVKSTDEIAWFGEGFTEYYTEIVLLRAGLETVAEFRERIDGVAKEYQESSRINATNAELQGSMQADHDTYREPYVRGMMIALWLNSEIVRQSNGAKSLDDLMWALRSDRQQVLDSTRIFRTAAQFVGITSVEQLKAFALDGQTVPKVSVSPDQLPVQVMSPSQRSR